ncbi:MAG: histidine kinase [Flavobacteriaceae bacterium]|nr:histidine kinase [Flavobacteriaceae bacterium]
MRFKYILLLFLLFPVFLISQDEKQDSILHTLKVNTQRDSLRVELLLDAVYYYRSREFEKATPLIKEAIAISEEKNYKILEGRGYLYLSRNERRKGLLDDAIKNVLVAINIFEAIGNNNNLMLSNSHLGMLFQETGFPKKAIKMHLENIIISKNDVASGAKARYYFDAGNAYLYLKEYQNAEKYFLEAVKISKESNFIPGEMIMLSTLGQLYIETKKYNKAEQNINKALSYFEETGQLANIAGSYFYLGDIQSHKHNYKEAISLYNKALDIYNQINHLMQIRDTNSKLFIAYSITENYKKADKANKIYTLLNDSIDSSERNKMIAEMKTKYETDKIAAQKEAAEIKASLAENEIKQKKNYLIGAIIIGALILLASLFFIGRLRATKKAELITIELRETQKRLALEKQYRESELKALKSQMNPHFIFNALNSIQEYIVLNKKELASDYLGKFADLIRTYLHHSDTGKIAIQEEVDSLKTYLDLESLRFEDKLQYTFEVSEGLNTETLHIPTMLIQPYVENALKHGLLHKKNHRRLSIKFSKLDTTNLQCIIEDNGVGRKKAKEFQEKRLKSHKPFAAKATESRLDLLNFGKNKKIGVQIIDLFNEDNLASGTKVILSIPMIKV